MNIGKLQHRIEIQDNVFGEQDAHGNVEKIPTTLATVWADVMPLSGRELLLAQQVNATTTHAVRIRASDLVKPQQWILFKGRTLDINSIVNDRESDRVMLLSCTERVI